MAERKRQTFDLTVDEKDEEKWHEHLQRHANKEPKPKRDKPHGELKPSFDE